MEGFEAQVQEIRVLKKKKFMRGLFVEGGGSIGTNPARFEKSIIFSAADGIVYSVDLDTGKENWRFKTNGPIVFCNVVIDENRAYFGSYDGSFYCIDAKCGKKYGRFRQGTR